MIVCIVVAVVIGIGLIYFFQKSDWSGSVTSFDWKREWDVERYQFVSGNCWYNNCQPNRAYNLNPVSEIHHWNRVKTGESCTTDSDGDKHCSPNYTSYPVYETKIYYTINDWRLGRIAKSSGNDNQNIYWPELNLKQCDNNLQPGIGIDDPLLNCERSAIQREWVYINIKADNPNILSAHCQIDYPHWSDMNIGFNVHGSYWSHQNLIDCGDLKYGK